MGIDRTKIMLQALEQLGIEVWHTTRYANDSGTLLRCVTGTMVMVPDDAATPYFMRADGADELLARVAPVFERLAAEATGALDKGGPRAALIAAADALHQEGYDAGYQAALEQTRALFFKVVEGKFGALPPSVSARIAEASIEDMMRWTARMQTVRHVSALIV